MPSPVEWFYSEQGRQVGPVKDSDLEHLLGSGRIKQETLVWHTGMTEWQPLHVARPSGDSGLPLAPPDFRAPPPADASVCVECGQLYPHSEMIVLNRSWVCGNCKPIFVQRLKEGVAPALGMVWRDGKEFVVAKGSVMPDRCVKCNAPGGGLRLKRRFYWHNPALYLLLLFLPLAYILIAIFVTKRASIEISVCEKHRRQRSWIILCSLVAVALGVVLVILGFEANGYLFPIGGLFLVGAIAGAMRATLIVPGRIDPEGIWVRGGGPAFLESLPEWPGPKNL